MTTNVGERDSDHGGEHHPDGTYRSLFDPCGRKHASLDQVFHCCADAYISLTWVKSSTVANRFHLLIKTLAQTVEQDYQEARKHAREDDSQRAAREGESTWLLLLTGWGPGWPVVTRKYIVGPSGDTNEVDAIVLKPDSPAH